MPTSLHSDPQHPDPIFFKVAMERLRLLVVLQPLLSTFSLSVSNHAISGSWDANPLL